MKNKGLRILLALTLTFTTFLTSVSQGANFALFDSFAFNKVVPNDWNPRKLFLDGTQGCFFDPSDLTTVFQDAAGTIPGAIGSPVGLMLDKSQGLVRGAELVTNGGGDSITGWTYTGGAGGSVASLNGELQLTNATVVSTALDRLFRQTLTLTVGKTYEFKVKLRKGTTSSVTAGVSTSASSIGSAVISFVSTSSTPDAKVGSFVATATTMYLLCVNSGVAPGDTGYFDDISIRELPGNHASQSTSSAKPILRQDAGGRYYLEFDGVDDRLDVAAPHLFSPMTASTAFRGTNANSHFVWCTYDGATYGANLYSTNGAALQIYPSYTVGTRTGLEQVTTYISKPNVDSWNNGIQVANNLVSAGIADNNGALGIGGRPTGSFFFAGRIYGLLIAKKALADSDRQKLERYMARKIGVTL